MIVLALIIVVFGKKDNKFNLFSKDTARAISATEGLEMIEKKNPVKLEIDRKIEEEALREEERLLKEKAKKNDSKIAYLTFDDGPSKKTTPLVLDTLKKHGIKATFFVVGTSVEENPDILKEIYDQGHQIGNHSYSHSYGYIYANVDNFMKDMYKAEELIKSVVGDEFDSKIMRFPGGSFEAKKDPMKNAVLNAGYNYIDWNALNGDAEGVSISEENLVNRLKETVAGKKKIVILMHDTDQKITTARSLDDSIKFLLDEGYEFQILDKNFSWE